MATICFLLFFFGSYVAGLAGWEVVILFVVGLALVVSEIVVHPGTIIPGLVGLLLVCASLIWAMTDRYPHEPLVPTATMLERPLLNLAITVVLCAVIFPILARYLPATPLFRAVALGRSNPPGPSFSPDTVGSPARIAVGASGIALSNLRPSGNAQFESRVVDVVTRGEFIEPTSPVRVLAVEGSRVVVGRA